MARKVGQIIAVGDRRWLIRVYLGRNHETKKRKYHRSDLTSPSAERVTLLSAGRRGESEEEK